MPYYPRELEQGRDLHRIFASLPDDENAVLEFVATWGFLGLVHHPNPLVRFDPDRDDSDPSSRESESISEILLYRNELKRVLDYIDASEGFLEPSAEIFGSPKKGIRLGPKELRERAVGLFNATASQYLGQFRFVLQPEQSGPYGGASVGLKIQPRTLLASIWLATVEDIMKGAQHKPCKFCKKFFRIGEFGSNANRDTCSDKCRTSWSRKNRSELKPQKSKRKK